MPGFFDFTEPNPNSPMDNGEQSWGGDMIYGGNQPIAPQSNPFDSNMPQMPQGGMNSQVPFDALSAMNGIQMPQIPQQDSMGRYGVTDSQRSDAGMQSLASILMGAGQTMFAENPNAMIQAAGASGGIRRGALDKASQDNVNAFKLQVEAKAKELDFLSKKSDIAKQQMQIEAEQMKLEELKLKRQVAVQFGKEMAPVAAEALQKAQSMYPDKVDSVKQMFLAAQAKLAEGDIDGASARFDLAMMELPSEWAKEAHEKMLKATVEASNKFGIGLEMAKNPELVGAVKAAGGRIDIGDDGMPKVVTKQEIEIEKLRKQQLEASIAAERAQEAAYGNRQPAGGLTQGQLINEVQEINAAVDQMLVPVPQVDDPAKQYEINLQNAARVSKLAPIGVTPEQWRAMTNDQRIQAVFRSKAMAMGGQGGGAVAPPQVIGGAPVQQGNPIAMIKQAAGGTPEQKASALKAMGSNPGTAQMINDAKKVLGLVGKPKNKQEADNWTNILFTYVSARTAK